MVCGLHFCCFCHLHQVQPRLTTQPPGHQPCAPCTGSREQGAVGPNTTFGQLPTGRVSAGISGHPQTAWEDRQSPLPTCHHPREVPLARSQAGKPSQLQSKFQGGVGSDSQGCQTWARSRAEQKPPPHRPPSTPGAMLWGPYSHHPRHRKVGAWPQVHPHSRGPDPRVHLLLHSPLLVPPTL